jgi:small subunit ribosomal protein S16
MEFGGSPFRYSTFQQVARRRSLVAMRLTRVGSKKRPCYRIVVIEKRRAQNGRFLEIVGQYNPLSEPAQIEVNEERARYWLSKGARPSDTVRSLLRKKEIV